MNNPYSTSLTPAGSTNLPTKPSLSNWHTAHIRFKHGCVSRGFRTRYQLFRRPGCHGLASPQATVAAGEQPPATSDSNVGIDGFDKTRFIAGNRREKKQDQIPVRKQDTVTLRRIYTSADWEGLEPLPPNTRAAQGEKYADARRALWRHLNPRRPWPCPGCQQDIYKLDVLSTHLRRCCPDLFSDLLPIQVRLCESYLRELDATEGETKPLRHLLHTAAAKNAQLSEHALDLSFRQTDTDGVPLRLSAVEVAAAMHLPEDRVQLMMRLAMKKVPLIIDEAPLEILYEDEHLLAVNKVPGVLTAPKHRFEGGSMVNRVLGYLKHNPYVLHRLDMNTSGVLLFGKTLLATRDVHRQFRQRSVSKTYLAVSAGVPPQESFDVDAPIGRHDALKLARVTKGASDSQESHTAFRVLSVNADVDLSGGTPGDFPGHVAIAVRGASLLRCFPLTGRTHQIRVHLGHVGHAIIGDDFYGTKGPWIPRQALHAETLTVDHPSTGQRLQFRAPIPEDFAAAMVNLDLKWPNELSSKDTTFQEVSIQDA